MGVTPDFVNGCPRGHMWSILGLQEAFGQRCGALESEGRLAKLRFKLLNYTHTRGSDLALLGPLLLRRRDHVDKTGYLTGFALPC